MKHFAVIILVLLSLTSCLDEHPRDQIPEAEAYTSAKSLYINAVSTLYNYIGGHADSEGLQGTYRGVYDYNTFTTDEAMLPTRGGDWYDGGFWQNLYLHRWTSTDRSLYDTWGYLYKVIVICNRSLTRIEENKALLTDAQKAVYEAEVRAVRTMYYYYLIDMFGNVPLVVSEGTSIKDIEQSSRSKVFRFVFDEFQAVAPLLPNEHSNREGAYYGRITRPVVWFLLAKLALNAEVYADDDWTDGTKLDGKNIYFTVAGRRLNAWQTVECYADSIASAGYSLEDNYAKNFSVHNESSVENIFTIPMNKIVYANQFHYLFRSRHYRHGDMLGMGSENGTSATVSTVETYGYGTGNVDARYALNFYSDTLRVDGSVVYLSKDKPLVYMPLEVKLDLTGTEYEKTAGARMSKYEIDRTAYLDGKLQDNDIVLFRYADVLLMTAEAKVRNGENGDRELNRVRARAGMPARSATLKNILDERLLELMWEGWRRQDLIRFGKFSSSYDQRPQLDGESSGYTTVFPIPDAVCKLNVNLKQNSGYK
ncbi:RagB/SusD family nutrient uptake outer membrane protein [Hoylesella oralis]|uniref:RagB/SusD family nutrient uptake outer membrane protein n=1 Tax=Hoylesella oralis TaxID=28134 RepID=UPI0028EAC350|nr:RagB/SusD family nutrient uptake outer membrane protein [Hoylesella oralis]